MGFLQNLRTTTQRHLRNLQDAHDRRVEAAEERAKAQLARARTKAEREKAKLSLQREKLVLKRELYEAKIATNKAKAAVAKARKEAGDLTVGEVMARTYRSFAKATPKRRVVRRRKAVARKTAR